MPETNPLYDMDDEALIEYLTAKAETHARNILIQRGQKEMVAFWHLVSAHDNFIIATPWKNDKEKDLEVRFIRSKLKSDNAKAYCFTCEAWMARYDKGEVPANEQWPAIRPSQSPRRIEVVAIFAATRSKQLMRVLEMIRDPQGKLFDLRLSPGLGMNDGEEQGKLGGTMPSLFEGL